MMAVFTDCTFAWIRSAPELANTDAKPVLGQRHSENNGITSARRRTVFLLPPWRSAVAAHEEPSRMPLKFFQQPYSHVSSALCAGDRFHRRRGASSAAGQQDRSSRAGCQRSHQSITLRPVQPPVRWPTTWRRGDGRSRSRRRHCRRCCETRSRPTRGRWPCQPTT